MSFLNESSTTFLAGAAAAATIVVVSTLWLKKNNKENSKLKRSWSFTSEGMRIGVFPPKVNAPPTMVNVILSLEKPPTVDELLEKVVQPLLEAEERFRMIPTPGGLREPTTSFQPKDLIRDVITVKGDDDELRSALDQIALTQTTLPDGNDRELPWWELILVKNNKAAAVLLRIHHCLGDGLALITVFDDVGIIKSKDGSANRSKVTDSLVKRKKKVKAPSIGSIFEAIGHVAMLPASKHDDFDATKLRAAEKHFTLSQQWKIHYLPQVPLSFIKALKTASQTSVNDVLVCAISQAIYEASSSSGGGDVKKQQQCRALLPVSLPRSTNIERMRNQFVMMSASIHVDQVDIMDRLEAIRTTTSFLKSSPRAFVQLWMQNNIVSKLPVFLAQKTADDIFDRHSLVLTNVPGPEQSCWFAGKQVTEVQLLFPNVIPQVDLLSYAGSIYGNIIYDPQQFLINGEQLVTSYVKALVTMGERTDVNAPKELQNYIKEHQ